MISTKPLSAATQRWLRDQEASLKVLGSKRVKTKLKALQEVLKWCISLEIDLVPTSSLQKLDFVLKMELLNSIEEVQRVLKQTSFRENLTGVSRIEQGKISNQEQKALGLSPSHNRILVRMAQPILTSLNYSVQFLDLNLQQLDLSQFTSLLVVENLDCFYQLEKFSITENNQQLVIYRGDGLYSKGCKALKQAWLATNKPASYFGDFDPAGVTIALDKTYKAMLLPKLSFLKTEASTAMLPDEQLKYLAKLAKYTNLTVEFQTYCQLLHEVKALRQQRMLATELVQVKLWTKN